METFTKKYNDRFYFINEAIMLSHINKYKRSKYLTKLVKIKWKEITIEHFDMNLREFQSQYEMTPEIINYMIDVLFGAIEDLHSMRIQHCDIKPDNIFIKTNNNNFVRCVLGDYDLSEFIPTSFAKINDNPANNVSTNVVSTNVSANNTILVNNKTNKKNPTEPKLIVRPPSTQIAYSREYRPPEINLLSNKMGIKTTASDIWAAGLTLYKIIFGVDLLYVKVEEEFKGNYFEKNGIIMEPAVKVTKIYDDTVVLLYKIFITGNLKNWNDINTYRGKLLCELKT